MTKPTEIRKQQIRTAIENKDIDALKRLLSDITELDLSISPEIDERPIGEEGAEILAEAIKGNETLITLNLSRNQLGSNGTIAIFRVLKYNRKLTDLDLSYNEIGEEGGDKIERIAATGCILVSCNLLGNNIEALQIGRICAFLQRNRNIKYFIDMQNTAHDVCTVLYWSRYILNAKHYSKMDACLLDRGHDEFCTNLACMPEHVKFRIINFLTKNKLLTSEQLRSIGLFASDKNTLRTNPEDFLRRVSCGQVSEPY